MDTFALGDYGSDDSALPMSLVREIGNTDTSMEVISLSEPVPRAATIKSTDTNPIHFIACRTLRLSKTIVLLRTSLRVQIGGTKLLAVDQEMDEVLLRRLLFRATDFDLERHLETVPVAVDRECIEELSSTSLKSYSVPYSGIICQQTDDDPAQLPQSASAVVGIDSAESIEDVSVLICTKNRRKNSRRLIREDLSQVCRSIAICSESSSVRIRPLVLDL